MIRIHPASLPLNRHSAALTYAGGLNYPAKGRRKRRNYVAGWKLAWAWIGESPWEF